jgi:hypothetical protein
MKNRIMVLVPSVRLEIRETTTEQSDTSTSEAPNNKSAECAKRSAHGGICALPSFAGQTHHCVKPFYALTRVRSSSFSFSRNS